MSQKARGVATAIEGFAACAWFSWASSAPPRWLTVPLGVGSGVGLILAIIGFVLARRSHDGLAVMDDPAVGKGYRNIVVVEALACVGGAIVLGTTHNTEWISAWIALVVGVHFIPMAGVLGKPSMRVTGVAICLAAVAAVIVGRETSQQPSTVAGTGAGVVLLVTAFITLAEARRAQNAGQPQPSRVSL